MTVGAAAVALTAARPAPRRQRVASAAAVSVRCRAGDSVLDQLDQRGGAKIRLPRSGSDRLDAVLINTAGGLTGGDRIDWDAAAGDGARLRVSTAASEKVYRSDGEVATQRTRLRVGRDAQLHWLPQETIVFDGARLERRLDVDIAAGGTLLALECLVLGRRSHGERLRRARIDDRWNICYQGRLLHVEALRLDAEQHLTDGSDACLGADDRHTALATLVLAAPHDVSRLDATVARLRRALSQLPDEGRHRFACTLLPGRLVLRGVAENGHALRCALVPLLAAIDGAEALPRVWFV